MLQKSHLIGFPGCITHQIGFHLAKLKKNIHGKNHTKIIKLAVKKLTNPIKLQRRPRNFKNMIPGNLSSKIFLILTFFYFSALFAEERVNLEDIQPTFEEELENLGDIETEDANYIRLKKKTKNQTTQKIVNLRALDKITAKTLDINIVLGEKKRFGYLEIIPKNCKRSADTSESGGVAYLQVKDLSDKRDEKIFVFNGWTFSSSPTLRPFDHPVYDLWLTGCENI